jgi:hypothetical protein
MWELWALAAVASGCLGAWIAVQKRRGAPEGLTLGLLFGPLGVLVELFLPQGEKATGAPKRRNIDDLGTIASIADRFRTALDETDPAWERLPYHRKRRLLKPVEKQVSRELGLPPTQFADFAAEARRLLFGAANRAD